MFRLKIAAALGLSAFISFACYSADNQPSKAPQQDTAITQVPDQKLEETLKATKMEIEIREKILKDMQDRQNEMTRQQELEKKEGAQAGKSKSTLHTILMYIPNRFIDMTDIFSIGGGVGPEISAEFAFTKYCQMGGSYGDRYFLEKGYNRQNGGGYSSGYNLPFLCWNKEQLLVDYTFGYVDSYVILNDERMSIQSYKDQPYKGGYADFWEIGVKSGWLVDFECYFHPVAMANFFTGFVFVRLTDTQDL